MKKSLCILLGLIATVSAQTLPVPLRWRIETSRPAAEKLELYRGETVRLQPLFEAYGVPVAFPTNALPTLLYRSADMAADAYHQISGTLLAETGRVEVVWGPPGDNGATRYEYSLVITNQTEAIVRANGVITITETIYGTHGTPLALTNAPAVLAMLASHTGATSNPHNVTAAQVGAYTTNEVDALLASLPPGYTDAQAVSALENDGSLFFRISSAFTIGQSAPPWTGFTFTPTSHADFGLKQLRNLAQGTSGDHAVTKAQMETAIAAAGTPVQSVPTTITSSAGQLTIHPGNGLRQYASLTEDVSVNLTLWTAGNYAEVTLILDNADVYTVAFPGIIVENDIRPVAGTQTVLRMIRRPDNTWFVYQVSPTGVSSNPATVAPVGLNLSDTYPDPAILPVHSCVVITADMEGQTLEFSGSWPSDTFNQVTVVVLYGDTYTINWPWDLSFATAPSFDGEDVFELWRLPGSSSWQGAQVQ